MSQGLLLIRKKNSKHVHACSRCDGQVELRENFYKVNSRIYCVSCAWKVAGRIEGVKVVGVLDKNDIYLRDLYDWKKNPPNLN